MAQSNIIVNGDFALGNTGWGGNDLETNYAEGAYLGNGSTNNVAELDGHTGQVTVMTQTVKIGSALDTDLTFRTALRTSSLPNAGNEGFTVEVLNSDGKVIATQTFLPKTSGWTDHAMSVSFPAAGEYTIRLTETGKDDSLGAILDNVSMLVCFADTTRIETDRGAVAAGALVLGDRVWTLDAGFQPIRWIGRRKVSPAEQAADPNLRPILFRPGALGPGVPSRRMALSPQHRVCLSGWRAEIYFGQAEVLVPAQALVNGTTIRRAGPTQPVTYVHFLLDGHQIVRSDGALTESFLPTALSIKGLDRAARDEVLRLFPDLAALTRAYPATARPVLRPAEARLVA